jgi:hypothetical protein
VSPSTRSGYAIAVIWEPALESRRPLWNKTKSRFRCSGTALTGRRY